MKADSLNKRAYAGLIVDLDGTLIGRDERMSSRVGKAVRAVSERLRVSIASGREPSDVLRFAKQLGLTTPQISDNGALILDAASGAPLWSSPLEPAYAREVVGRLQSMGTAIIATHPGGTIADTAHITDWSLTRVSALDMDEALADQLVAQFQSNLDLHVVKVSLPYNGMWAVDFTRVGVNKGTAARKVAEMIGIEPSQIIAAGDSYNDLPLLEACGLRVAMGHAPDELKAIADYVAPTVDDDGLAVAIEELVLPRL